MDFKAPVGKIRSLPPEANLWWWHPNRAGVRQAPEWFRDKLEVMDPTLAITWNSYRERWQVWMRSPNFQTPVCQGWKLLFVHEDASHGHLPLDERVLARLYNASADKWGNGREYFIAVERELAREREKQAAKDLDDQIQMAMPYFDHSQIQISMRGKSSGSKFSEYHS